MTAFQPRLYYYEHCPYCVRVLAFVGMAGISLKYTVLLNDDESTPKAMTGVKSLPILEKEQGEFMGESLDIISYLSDTCRYELVASSAWETTVTELLAEGRLMIYGLTMPRWVQLPFGEFATPEAVTYFINKKTQTIGDFATALANTPRLIQQLHQVFTQYTELFSTLTQKPQSVAAIMLFSGLYGVTAVKELQWSEEAERFMQTMFKETGMYGLGEQAI